jgi:hypothetical protein
MTRFYPKILVKGDIHEKSNCDDDVVDHPVLFSAYQLCGEYAGRHDDDLTDKARSA